MSRRTTRHFKTLYDKEQEELLKQQSYGYHDIKRGEVYYFKKVPTIGVEQQGGRPGVIVSTDACNESSDFVLVCYLTTQPKTTLPTHVPVMCEQESICLCEQVHTLSKERLERYCCTLSEEEMAEIDKALLITLGINTDNISLEACSNATKTLQNILSTRDERIDFLEKELETKDLIIVNHLATIGSLKKEKNSNDAENAIEYAKVCAERDVYMKLYYELLEQRK